MAERILRFPGSKTLQEARYDPATGVLVVRFASTKSTWTFPGISSAEFAILCVAHSPGEAFTRYIRPHHTGQLIEVDR